MNKKPQLVGRNSEFDLLKEHIQCFAAAPASPGGLKIVSLAGSGGVGKSFLLNAVMDETRGALKEALTITIDARNEHFLQDFNLLIDQMLAPIELPLPAKAKHDYFPASRSLLRRQLKLFSMVDAELSNDQGLSEHVKTAAKGFYRMIPVLGLIPKYGPPLAVTLQGLEVVKAEEYVEPALKALNALKSLRENEGGWFSNRLTKNRFTKLRHSPYEAISDAYVSDLSAMLRGYRKEDRWSLTHPPVKGLNRLLLIVDDYESVGRVIGTFLIESLLPRLKNASFSTLLIILGRDSVKDADKEFDKSLAGNIVEPIRLEPFTESEGVKYMMSFGYTEGESREWYEKSRGLPFILKLLAENRTDEQKQSAVFYKRFYERTTCWMSSQERKWLTPICYLDRINEGTVKVLLPHEDSTKVVNWFVNDASVRDVKSRNFSVTPYIRHMLLEYNRCKVGDAAHARLQEEAKRAMQEA